jgi:hypothetical protein
MPPIRNIEHGWANLDNGMTTLQGFLGWRLEMTAASAVTRIDRMNRMLLLINPRNP